MDPRHCRFTRTHEWVHLDGDVATVGISEFAVRELTDLVYIDLPKVGARVDRGAHFGEIESVKAVSDLYAPLAGEVVAVNSALADDLGPLSADPFGSGWIARLRVDNPAAVADLLDFEAYTAFCNSGGH